MKFDGLLKCNKCGACTAVCPLYQHTVYEGMAARGKLALLEAVLQGKLQPPRAVREKLEDCLLCGACAANCPSLVPTTALFLEARAELAGQLGIPLPIRMFLTALASPGSQAVGMPAARLLQRSGLPRLFQGSVQALLPPSVHAALRQAPAIPAQPYRSRLSSHGRRGGGRGTVAYFAGCFMNWIYADAAGATRRVLEHCDYRVEVPPVVCCGLPHRVYGDVEGARRLARTNIERLETYPAIVTDCATCGAALKEYRQLLADDPLYQERAEAVSGRVADIAEFLARHGIPRPASPVRLRVTYHEPCHLGRGQGVKTQPRDLLRSIPGIEFVEMKEADVCCGGAGSFCITHPDLSQKVGAAKVENVLATGADLVASGCPSCITQLRALLRARSARVRVCHPIELWAEGQTSTRASGPPLAKGCSRLRP